MIENAEFSKQIWSCLSSCPEVEVGLAAGMQKHGQGSLEGSIFFSPNFLAPEEQNIDFSSMEPTTLPHAGLQPQVPGIPVFPFPYSVRAGIKPHRKSSRPL